MTTALTYELHQAILDLLAQYCERVDRYDIDAVAETFTEDAVTDYGPGRGGLVTGRTAIRDRIARGQAEFRRTHHQLGQILLEPGPDGVHGITYVTAHHERWDGTIEVACLRYVDVITTGPDGPLLASRRVEADVVQGFEGVAWVWTPRALPDGVSPA